MVWHTWAQRNKISNIKEPGIYYIAYSENDLSDTPFNNIPEIIYIGMSISQKGVKGRLSQFERGMNYKSGHGGADRARLKHTNTALFFKNAFIAVKSFPLTHTNEVYDWRQKGECVKHEYVSFAAYLEKFGELPEFNDMQRSKKMKIE